MNTRLLLLSSLFILFTISPIYCETNETATNTTAEPVPETSEKDILIAELKVLQDQITINQKKLQLLEGIRSVSLGGNQTITVNLELSFLNDFKISKLTMQFLKKPLLYKILINNNLT